MKIIALRKWYENWFCSADNLHTAYLAGNINMATEQTTYGANYTFTTKQGAHIATIYKDSTFGFSSQAYGIKLTTDFVNSVCKLPEFKLVF